MLRSDLLLVYLEGADMLLDSALEDLGEGSARDSTGKSESESESGYIRHSIQ